MELDIDWKVIRRKIKNYSLVLVAIGIVLFAFWLYHQENKNIVPYNEYPDGSVLVVKNTYTYPYKTIIAIYKNGKVKISKIIDEINETGKPKEHYKDVTPLTYSETKELEALIKDVADHRTVDMSEQYYGILIKTSNSSTLENAGNFEHEYVQKLNDFIEKIRQAN